MRTQRCLVLLCICLLTVASGFSQILTERAPVDLFLGYSYLNADTNSLTPRQSLNGWSSSSSLHFSRWLALEGEASGYYRNNILNSGVDARDYSFTAGPRVNFARRFFAHALFGDDHMTVNDSSASAQSSAPALRPALIPAGAAGYYPPPPPPSGSSAIASTSEDGFVMIFGGGIQWSLSRTLSVRTSVDYVGTHHYGAVQNNVRVGGGVVYTLHSRQRPIIARAQ